MKVGIVTFHRSHNYGALLQAYALSRWIRENHQAKVEFLNYQPAGRKGGYRIFVPIRSPRDLKTNLQNLLRYRTISRRYRGFVGFQTKEFTLTPEYSTSEEIRRAKPDHDAWISGSDQVFRYYGPESDVFYLDFLQGSRAKKIAYAPSFGASNVEEQHQQRVSELLRGFDFLSCRESEGAELIRRISGLEAELVVDPVFLLSREQWRELFVAPSISGRYILVYALVGYQKQLEIAKRIKALTGLPIYVIYPTRITDGEVAQTLCTTDPYQFGGLIDRADYVVTDSFHGLAFSLLFQKNFFCHIALQHSASRHRSLLGLLGLTARMIDDPAAINTADIGVDYSIAASTLSDMITGSKKYLDNALASIGKDV